MYLGRISDARGVLGASFEFPLCSFCLSARAGAQRATLEMGPLAKISTSVRSSRKQSATPRPYASTPRAVTGAYARWARQLSSSAILFP